MFITVTCCKGGCVRETEAEAKGGPTASKSDTKRVPIKSVFYQLMVKKNVFLVNSLSSWIHL